MAEIKENLMDRITQCVDEVVGQYERERPYYTFHKGDLIRHPSRWRRLLNRLSHWIRSL